MENCYGKQSCNMEYHPDDWETEECKWMLESSWYEAVYYATCGITTGMKLPYSDASLERENLTTVISCFDLFIIAVFIVGIICLKMI